MSVRTRIDADKDLCVLMYQAVITVRVALATKYAIMYAMVSCLLLDLV